MGDSKADVDKETDSMDCLQWVHLEKSHPG